MRGGQRRSRGDTGQSLAADIADALAAAMEKQRAPALGLAMLARHRDQRRWHPGANPRGQCLLVALQIIE